MSTSTAPRNALLDALGEDAIVPMGTRSAQENNTGIYVSWPQPHARNQGIDQGADVEVLLHAKTGAMIYLPPGCSMTDFLDRT